MRQTHLQGICHRANDTSLAGFIDHSVTKHEIVYHHVNPCVTRILLAGLELRTLDRSLGFWQVGSTAYAVDGQSYRNRDNTAILDTGTTLCLIHDDAVERIYHKINGAKYSNSRGGWIYPNRARLPEIHLAIGHTMYRVRPQSFPRFIRLTDCPLAQ